MWKASKTQVAGAVSWSRETVIAEIMEKILLLNEVRAKCILIKVSAYNYSWVINAAV